MKVENTEEIVQEESGAEIDDFDKELEEAIKEIDSERSGEKTPESLKDAEKRDLEPDEGEQSVDDQSADEEAEAETAEQEESLEKEEDEGEFEGTAEYYKQKYTESAKIIASLEKNMKDTSSAFTKSRLQIKALEERIAKKEAAESKQNTEDASIAEDKEDLDQQIKELVDSYPEYKRLIEKIAVSKKGFDEAVEIKVKAMLDKEMASKIEEEEKKLKEYQQEEEKQKEELAYIAGVQKLYNKDGIDVNTVLNDPDFADFAKHRNNWCVNTLKSFSAKDPRGMAKVIERFIKESSDDVVNELRIKKRKSSMASGSGKQSASKETSVSFESFDEIISKLDKANVDRYYV